MTPEDIIGTIAAALTTLSFVPQAIKTIKTQDTKSLSFWMYLLSFIGVIFWLILGIMINNYPIIVKNVIVIALSGVILYVKTLHVIRDREDIKQSRLGSKMFKLLGFSKR